MRFKILLLALLTAFRPAFAQDIYTLSGTVIDADKNAVNAGEMTILSGLDSSVVKKTNIMKGRFVFEPIVKGQYILKTSSMGFANKFDLLTLDETKSIVVTLERRADILREVTVAGSRKTFLSKNGNTIVNVEGSQLESLLDAITLLSKIPMVQVSPDGESLQVVGKGQPLIYIDNQKRSMDDLKSLSVNDIKTIEVINNPSSKYEAEGRVVIAITRRSSRQDGWKGDVAETAAYRKYYLNRFAANSSLRRKKLELKTNVQYNQLRTWEGNSFDMRILDKSIDTRYSVTAVTTRPQFIGEAGAYYQINDGDYISVNANMRTQHESFPINTSSSLSTPDQNQNVLTSTYNRNPNTYSTASLNYNKKLGSGNLFTGLQQTGFTKDLATSVFNDFDGNGNQLSQLRRQKSHIHALAARADFDMVLPDSMKWELGAAATTASASGFTTIVQNNSGDGSTFSYRESNVAAYTQISGKFKKLDWSAGLRSETTRVISNYDDNTSASAIRKSFTNLFPKANISIPLDSASQLNFSVARSIQRPDYSNANQTAIYINPFFQWANNINLNPSYTTEATVTWQFHQCSAALTAFRNAGAVYDRFQFDDSKNILTRSERNYDFEKGLNVTVSLPFRWGAWSSTNNIAASFSTLRDAAAVTGKSRPYGYVYSSNEIKLPAGFQLTVAGWATTEDHTGVYYRSAVFSLDTSVTKALFKNLNCTLRLNDAFRSIRSQQDFSVDRVAATGVFEDNAREIALIVKYSFGKLKESNYKNRGVNEGGERVR